MAGDEGPIEKQQEDSDHDAGIASAPVEPSCSSSDADELHENEASKAEEGKEEEKKANKSLSEKKLKRLKDAYDKKGVVYISRIPPHMKPQKLRHMLSEHGDIGRLYLAPEDPSLRKRRKKHGGDTGKNFTEGWVEFEDKKVAKRVAMMLNGNPMGGKRRSAYHYDLWSLKYLPKFKWDNLTEEITYQNAVREQKLANELSVAKRERDFILGQVDKAKGVKAMQERKRKRLAEGEVGGGAEQHSGQEGAVAVPNAKPEPGAKIVRTYAQKKARPELAAPPAMAADMLALIGGKPKSAS